jgi:glycosyltransferase involved in cell wall biosynthesis
MVEDEKPEVTVLIPAYNRANLIIESLESVFAQTYRDFEIIVVDDGSTDNTAEVLHPLEEQGLLRYIYQKNAGEAAARNKGLLEARGRYIAFLDSDDLFEPEKLELQTEYLQNHPEVGLVHSGYIKFDNAGNNLGYRDASWFSGSIYPKILLYWTTLMAVDAVLIPRSVLENVGLFNENLRTGPDLDLWRRIARRYPFGFINKSLARVRVHEGNISGNKMDAAEGFAKYLNKAFEDDPALSLRFRQQAFSKMYSSMAYNLLGDENKQAVQVARLNAKYAMAHDLLNPHGYLAFLSTLLGYGLRKEMVTRWRSVRGWLMSHKLRK